MKTLLPLGALALALPLASLADGQEGRRAPGVLLRYQRPDSVADTIKFLDLHSLGVERLVLERAGADPVVETPDLQIWAGTRAEAVEEIDPRTGLLRREYGITEGYLQTGNVLEDGTEMRSPEMPLTSPLDGIGVSFVPAAGAPGGYHRHYDSSETLSEKLLERLHAPRDWSRLLPASARGEEGAEVVLGTSWELPPETMELLLAPLGDLVLRGSEETDPRILRAFNTGMGGNLHLGFDGDVRGTVTARLVGDAADPALGRVADIEVDFSLDLTSDRSEFARRRRLRDDPENELRILGAGLVLHLEGKSRVRWSGAAPSPVLFMTEGTQEVRVTVELEEPDGAVVRQSLELSGDLRTTARFGAGARKGSDRREG